MTTLPFSPEEAEALKVAPNLVDACRVFAEATLRDVGHLPTPFALVVWPGPEIQALMMQLEEGGTADDAASDLGEYMRGGGALAYAVVFGAHYSVVARKASDPDYSREVAEAEGLMIAGQDAAETAFFSVLPIKRTPEGDFAELGADTFGGKADGLWCSLLYPPTRH